VPEFLSDFFLQNLTACLTSQYHIPSVIINHYTEMPEKYAEIEALQL